MKTQSAPFAVLLSNILTKMRDRRPLDVEDAKSFATLFPGEAQLVDYVEGSNLLCSVVPNKDREAAEQVLKQRMRDDFEAVKRGDAVDEPDDGPQTPGPSAHARLFVQVIRALPKYDVG